MRGKINLRTSDTKQSDNTLQSDTKVRLLKTRAEMSFGAKDDTLCDVPCCAAYDPSGQRVHTDDPKTNKCQIQRARFPVIEFELFGEGSQSLSFSPEQRILKIERLGGCL